MPQLILHWFASPPALSAVAGILAALALALYLYNAVRLTVIDFRSHLLPNRILGPWFIAALVLLGAAALLAGEPMTLLRMVLGAVILFAGYLLLHLIAPAGMGLGDVKLAAVLGLYLGFLSYGHLLWATAFAFIVGALWSIALLLTRKVTLRSSVAFGPFMLVGAAVALAVAG
ncbi:prepilin peptidase [Paeniglutamicibacter psychrophenolicus]|uniref:prepilin peptidase n=1 Tax=Paeniglutamicibacter psychrophenolicus TaxID=257454 RepID=UPI002782324D|nr:A24 family peptidase [Paeniglutamicibacter psychrophenolicus]MDQ0092598.1 leader peptidase (prepilin peptidase)/N-methyltransferase [Paeniglutamicibacter psychrophenolicus]